MAGETFTQLTAPYACAKYNDYTCKTPEIFTPALSNSCCYYIAVVTDTAIDLTLTEEAQSTAAVARIAELQALGYPTSVTDPSGYFCVSNPDLIEFRGIELDQWVGTDPSSGIQYQSYCAGAFALKAVASVLAIVTASTM